MVVLRQEPVDVRRLQPPHVGDVQVHEAGGNVVVRRIQDLPSNASHGERGREEGGEAATGRESSFVQTLPKPW